MHGLTKEACQKQKLLNDRIIHAALEEIERLADFPELQEKVMAVVAERQEFNSKLGLE